MNRRTFLKAVFAAAVTPASVVRALYSPKAGMSDRDIADVITMTLNDLKVDPEWQKTLRRQRQLFKELEEAYEHYNEALFGRKSVLYCGKPTVTDTFYDMFKAGIIKTKPDTVESWEQPPRRRL
jgi:hypothetical protein